MLSFLLAALGLCLTGFALVPRLRRLAASRLRHAPPSVAVVIPARNEAHNLPALLDSLAKQSLRPQDVLVVDDESTDGTPDVAARQAARVLRSQPLPDGWRGKPWACQQGAEATRSDLLLFLDADTRLEPGGLAHLVAAHSGGALSVGPWHAVERPYENLSLFFNLNMQAGTIPRGLFGPLLLVDRPSYVRAGGHAAVRGRVLENLHLAQAFHGAGIPVRSANGRGIASYRMYPGGLAEVVEGWTKGFAAGAGQTPRGMLLLMVGWMTGLLLVPIGWGASGNTCTWGMAYAGCALQVAWLARCVGGFKPWSAALYPVPLLFFLLLFARSAWRSGKTTTWKGRMIHAD